MAVINSAQNPFDDLYILVILCSNHIMMELFMLFFLQLRKLFRIWAIEPERHLGRNQPAFEIVEKKVSTKENLRIDSFCKIEKIRKFKNKIDLFLNRLETKNFQSEDYQREFLFKNKSSANGSRAQAEDERALFAPNRPLQKAAHSQQVQGHLRRPREPQGQRQLFFQLAVLERQARADQFRKG